MHSNINSVSGAIIPYVKARLGEAEISRRDFLHKKVKFFGQLEIIEVLKRVKSGLSFPSLCPE